MVVKKSVSIPNEIWSLIMEYRKKYPDRKVTYFNGIAMAVLETHLPEIVDLVLKNKEKDKKEIIEICKKELLDRVLPPINNKRSKRGKSEEVILEYKGILIVRKNNTLYIKKENTSLPLTRYAFKAKEVLAKLLGVEVEVLDELYSILQEKNIL